MTSTIRLTGLDAQDPLAYLASLGCLLAVATRCEATSVPRMRFDLGGVPTPILEGPFVDAEALLDMLVEDLEVMAGRAEGPRDAFLAFSYDDDAGKPVQDLKPPPKFFRATAQGWIDGARHENRATVDWAAAVLTDVAVGGKGGAKPFALHFTGGNQRFLTIANELLDGSRSKPPTPGVGREDLRAAVFGPWPNNRTLKVFSWSPTQSRAYALRAADPQTDQKRGTPGADWLALRGIGLLSSAPKGSSIQTGGVHGKWNTGTFSYPVWPQSIDLDAVRSLLRHPALREADDARGSSARTLPRGVEVLTCRILRTEYGAFSRPSRR